MTVLTKKQERTFAKVYTEEGKTYRITAKVRHDDCCGNGHNSFAITADIDRKTNRGWAEESGGCLHEEVAKHFPNLAPYLKWHLCDTDGPMHYIANTVYFVEKGELNHARSSAIWPEATDEELRSPDLAARLQERLPALMAEFKAAVESLGFTY